MTRNGHVPQTLPGTVPDKLQPHNVEAERALLGSILIDDFRLSEISHLQLTGSDFYVEKLGWVFDTFLHLQQDGTAIGMITVEDCLRRDGRLVEFGGPAELSQLLTDTPTSTHALYYAKIVKDNAVRRKGLAKIGEQARIFHDDSADYRRQIAERAAELMTLVNEGSDQDWEIFTLADAYKERPPLVWAVQGLLSLPSLSIVYGAPGTMKSLLTADLLTCVAAGLPWLDPLPGQNAKPFQTVQSPVLWIDFDNGRRRTHDRFEAFARARNLPADTQLYYTSMPTPWLDASDQLAVDQLTNRIKRFEAKLVVLDNLGTISGGVDENSPEMLPVMSHLRQVTEKTGAAIIIIHHQRKSSGIKGRAGDALRGHSCIEAAIDLALLVERAKDSDQVTVKSTKTRDVDVQPFAAEWTYEHKPNSTDLAQARFFNIETEEDDTTMELTLAIEGEIRINPGINQKRLIETIKKLLPKASIHAIRNQIMAMADSGKIIANEGGTGRSTCYYANPKHIDL